MSTSSNFQKIVCNNVVVNLAEEKPASADGMNLPSWVSVCPSERSFQVSVCVCVLQVSRCPPWQRELSTDWPAALWPHLHRLSWPAADETAHGSLAQETQVSGMHTEPEGVAVFSAHFLIINASTISTNPVANLIGSLMG